MPIPDWENQAGGWGDLQIIGNRPAPFANVLAETYPRGVSTFDDISPLVSARLHLTSLQLHQGTTVTSIRFISGAIAAGTPTNWWFYLCTVGKVACGSTADQTTTAWAADTEKSLALTTPYVVTYTGMYYVGIMVKATTCPSLVGVRCPASINGVAPTISGGSSTGLAAPPGPGTAGAITATANMPYAYIV